MDTQNLNKLVDLIRDNRICMLATKQFDGNLKSRPMYVTKIDEEGVMWFFNNENSCKANEIKENPRVNLSFTNPSDKIYISVSGQAELSYDQSKIEEFMNDRVKIWFPKGLDDPNLSLLRIDLEKAEYWITEENKLKSEFEFTKAVVNAE